MKRPNIKDFFPEETNPQMLNDIFLQNIELYSYIKALDHYIDKLEDKTMPKIAEIKQMALQELELQDTKDDINNEDVSRKDLWRSAFVCGAIALMEKLDSNFSV